MPAPRPRPRGRLIPTARPALEPRIRRLAPGRQVAAELGRGRNEAAENLAVELAAGRRFSAKQTRRTFENLARVAKAAGQIARLPEQNESVHMILRGDFNAWDLVPAVLQLIGAPLAALKIATLGFNRSNADELLALIDARQVGRVDFLCSHFYAAHERETCARLARELAARGGRFAAMRTHAKVLLFQTAEAAPRFFVSESSANLRSCKNVEQLTLYQSRELFEFHADWMNELFNAAA